MSGPTDEELLATVADLSATPLGFVTAWSVQRRLAGLSGDPSLALVARRLGRLAREGRLNRDFGGAAWRYWPR